jgi:hypothetical protein
MWLGDVPDLQMLTGAGSTALFVDLSICLALASFIRIAQPGLLRTVSS